MDIDFFHNRCFPIGHYNHKGLPISSKKFNSAEEYALDNVRALVLHAWRGQAHIARDPTQLASAFYTHQLKELIQIIWSEVDVHCELTNSPNDL